MRRVLPRDSFLCRHVSVRVHNESRPSVSQRKANDARARGLPFLSDNRWLHLRQRTRVASFVRGRNPTKDRFRASKLVTPYVHRDSFFVSRRFTFGWLFQSAPGVSASGGLITAKQVVVGDTYGRVLSDPIFTWGRGVNVHVLRFNGHNGRFLRSVTLASGLGTNVVETSWYLSPLFRYVSFHATFARFRNYQRDDGRFFFFPKFQGGINDPHLCNACNLFHVYVNHGGGGRNVKINNLCLFRPGRPLLSTSHVPPRVRVRWGGVKRRYQRGVLSPFQLHHRFCLFRVEFGRRVRHGRSVFIVVCGRCFPILRVPNVVLSHMGGRP